MLALVTLVVVRALPRASRALRTLRAGSGGDRAARALAAAVRGLPAERAPWGRAMIAELEEVHGSRARRRFSVGCVRAAVALRIRAALGARDRGGEGLRAVVLGSTAVALGLALYGLVRYPGLRDRGAVGALAVLLVLLFAYAVCALTLSRGTTPEAVVARRHGLLGGLVIGASWLVVIAPTPLLKAWVFVPLTVALLAPACVAVVTGRTSRDARAASGAALWSGLVGGLLVFVVWVTATYMRNGGPYDPQLIRDFQRSGAHDLATYAVGDNIGAALGLLVIVPTVALALGSLAGLVAANERR